MTEGDDATDMSHGRAAAVEWAIAAVSALAVAGLVAILAVDGLRNGARQPELTVLVLPGDASELRFAVRNDGGRAAEAVTVALRLEGAETRRVVLDFVPAHSSREGAFPLGAGDAAAGPPEIESYLDP